MLSFSISRQNLYKLFWIISAKEEDPEERIVQDDVEIDMEDEDVDVESDDEDCINTKAEQDEEEDELHEMRSKLVQPRPLFGAGPHQPPFLAAGLAAMAAAASAAASKHPQSPQGPHGAGAAGTTAANPSLFFGLNGWQPPVSAPSFPPLGFPGFQHPLFKPGNP